MAIISVLDNWEGIRDQREVRVKVTFNGVPDRGSLIKYGKPLHVLGVPKTKRKQIGKAPGDAPLKSLFGKMTR